MALCTSSSSSFLHQNVDLWSFNPRSPRCPKYVWWSLIIRNFVGDRRLYCEFLSFIVRIGILDLWHTARWISVAFFRVFPSQGLLTILISLLEHILWLFSDQDLTENHLTEEHWFSHHLIAHIRVHSYRLVLLGKWAQTRDKCPNHHNRYLRPLRHLFLWNSLFHR